jgi:hypothetical protein
MPLDVIGEHAEKDVGTDPIDQVKGTRVIIR